jgi:hypothetical protein
MTASVSTEPAGATPTEGVQYSNAPTRPAAASRHARRPKAPRKVTRFTLDLEAPTHFFLRMWSLQEGVESARVLRTLLWLLEADPSLADRVREELFADEEPSNFTPEG